jgi:predicted nuclease of predicted toxin-antitoxin system
MRILIDECIDERFRYALSAHDCQNARYDGLAGLKNGELLTAAEAAGFEVLLTVDQGIEYQQRLIPRKLAIVIFRVKSNRLKDLLPPVPVCLTRIESIEPGRIIRIERPV